ncbi:MAG: hypothetical protein IEMM0002_0521 [bacterium]|nr:MAG: hypothetical protein IEMM0002_0521 [bacterium]
MSRILVSLPDELAERMRIVIPSRQRSRVIAGLLEKDIEKREKALYKCALAVEKDETLNREMTDWDTAVSDGLDDE